MPSDGEVAVVFVTAPDGALPSNRDLAAHSRDACGNLVLLNFTVQSHGGDLERIPDLSQHCNPIW